MAKDDKDLIVALDIGTSKVACLVAQLRPDGQLEMLGMGSHESKGLKKGVVVNIEATVAAIQRALEEAELMADRKISSAFVGIAGSHIKSFNSTGMVAIKDREVSALDVDRAIDTARADAETPVPRRALLSVSEKTGLVELGRGLVAAGFELVSDTPSGPSEEGRAELRSLPLAERFRGYDEDALGVTVLSFVAQRPA